jgi:iron(III) transport system substrate-binding protein
VQKLRLIVHSFCLTAATLAAGCGPRNEVVVYAALDREFSEPILQSFEQQYGIRPLARYDQEANKTVGLATQIIEEQGRPRCDLFWNNEILHSLRLEKMGLLEVYHSPNTTGFRPGFTSPQGAWCGFAARARVLLVNREKLGDRNPPSAVSELANPAWKGAAGLARPLFGTTATHAAVLFARLGPEAAEAFFREVKANAVVLAGNKQVAEAVGRGQLVWGLTDTDDAIIERDAGRPVEIIFPDQGGGEPGALFIPNTLCLIKGGPNPVAARKLVDFLLTPEVEGQLAEGASAQFPVNTAVNKRSRAAPPNEVRWMEVDFSAAADQWEGATAKLRSLYQSTGAP